jgi:DNA polymerase III delta' subunit
VEKKSIVWKNLIGQARVKEMLGAAFSTQSLGHAYLFCGDEGIGKFAAALELSMALLCENAADAPCFSCPSCQKVLRYSHPDFHVVLPMSLDKEYKASDGKLNQAGWDYLSSIVAEKIRQPYRFPSHSGVPVIPVEWIKEINHAIGRGAVGAGKNIAIIGNVDLMNKESANAMLKTLEEPPQNTIMILTTDHPQAVLPTIASRCQIVRFGHVAENDIKKALAVFLGPKADERSIAGAVAYAMGSPGRALSLADESLSQTAGEAREFWSMCCEGDWEKLGPWVDERAKRNDYKEQQRFFTYMMFLIRASFLQNTARSEKYIDGAGTLGGGQAALGDATCAHRLAGACEAALSSIAAYGNLAIVFVNFIMTVMEIVNVEKRKAG